MSNDPGNTTPPPANRPGQPSRRPPVSVFVWLLLIILMVTLFVYKYNPSTGDRVDWNQTQFEQNLGVGNVVTAVITPESEEVLQIRCEYTP